MWFGPATAIMLKSNYTIITRVRMINWPREEAVKVSTKIRRGITFYLLGKIPFLHHVYYSSLSWASEQSITSNFVRIYYTLDDQMQFVGLFSDRNPKR